MRNSWTNVTIKLDSKVVNGMVTEHLCRSTRWFHLTSLAILQHLPGIRILWIPRTENSCDNLSKQACMDRHPWNIQDKVSWLQQEYIPLPFHLLSHPHTILQPFTKLNISGFYTSRIWNVLFKVQLDPSKTKIATTYICANHPTERFPGREHYFTTQCKVSRTIYAFVAQKFQRDQDTILGLLWTATPPYTYQIPQDVWTLIMSDFLSLAKNDTPGWSAGCTRPPLNGSMISKKIKKMIVCTFHGVYHTLLYQPRMGVGVVFRSGNLLGRRCNSPSINHPDTVHLCGRYFYIFTYSLLLPLLKIEIYTYTERDAFLVFI